MNQILKIKYFLFLGILITIWECSNTRTIIQEKILVTYDGIPEISVGDTLNHIIEGNLPYLKEIIETKSHGREFMKLILKKENEEIAYINYDKDVLSWKRVSTIVCTHPKCTTKEGLSVGMSVKDFRRIYQINDTKLIGGKNKTIGYFIPEILKKNGKYVVMSKVVVELMDTKIDTLVTALIVESN